jgi:hypothetical protein
VFRLKFATAAFLPALADPFNWIYKKEILDRDPNWYQKNIMGSGPFKLAGFETGQSIRGVRNPDYYRRGSLISTGSSGSMRRNRRCGSMQSAATALRSTSAPAAGGPRRTGRGTRR